MAVNAYSSDGALSPRLGRGAAAFAMERERCVAHDSLSIEDERAKREAIAQLCHANGIREEDIQHPERVTNIEMVLDDYCCMGALQYFVNLKSVCLIQQAITTIEGLDSCPALERLLLNENRIKTVENLHRCSRLKCLHLCTNLIEELGNGLVGLTSLEVFWIAENLLSNLKGLAQAPNITELNVARNRLLTVIRSFDLNPKLTSLNLSDNRICSFREILDLARLPALRQLSFADPDWGENPICFLCNYQTYTLYHLPTLQVHDRMRISVEEHQAADIAFSKKRLYYNMRIKLLKRYAADGLRMTRTLADDHTSQLTRGLEDIARVLKRIDAFAQVRELNTPGAQPANLDASFRQDRSAVERNLAERQLEVADAGALWSGLSDSVQAERDALTRSLEMELQTGGNIRTEPGVAERDPWVKQIEDLVRTRFNPEDFQAYGVEDITVYRVTRVHNRSLRIRLEEVLDRSEPDVPHQVEYLFYAPDLHNPMADIRQALEEGCGVDNRRSCPTNGEFTCGPVILTNSVSVIEVPRLQQAAESSRGKAVSRSTQRMLRQLRDGGDEEKHATSLTSANPPVLCGGTLLLCSAHMSDQRADSPATFPDSHLADVREFWPEARANHFASPPRSASQHRLAAENPESPRRPRVSTSAPGSAPGRLVHERLEQSGDSVDASSLESSVAVHRYKESDPKQKIWRVSRTDMVLPEYIVEFDYVFSSPLFRTRMPSRLEEYGPLGHIFRDFIFHAKLGAPEAKEEDTPALPPQFQLPALPKVERLDTEQMPLLRSSLVSSPDASVFSTMQVLNLHGLGIRRIEPAVMQPLLKLRILLLSFNCLESVSCIPRLPTIETLDISFNLIEKVDALVGLPSLRHLDFSWNSLLSLEVIPTLAQDVPNLESLDIVGNPIARGSQCEDKALGKLKHLKHLNGREVSANEVLQAQQIDRRQVELVEAMIPEHAFTTSACQGPAERESNQRKRFTPPSIGWDSDRNCIARLLGQEATAGLPCQVTHGNWKGFVETLDLRNLGLTDLCDLSGLSQLRRIFLSGNQLSSLHWISQCTGLEELSVEENALTNLQGVAALGNLRRLDAGCNQISEVLDLQRLTKLSQLSLEDNYIDSLDTFSMLHGLMELYLSNNLIEELRSALMLKPLMKLVVLDLSGNSLCSALEYRFYTLFHLRRLKALDGTPVSPAEQQDADERFSGKLTMELLEDKLGPVPACYNLRSVDLSGLNLRELGQLLNDDIFPSLRELNIDGNPFSDIRTVGPMSKLLVLRANRSKIDLEKGVMAEEDTGGGVASMPHLQVLEVGYCGISDLSHFDRFPLHNLRILHLPGNDITKVEGLSHLDQLRELVLDRNKVKQFDDGSFAGLRSLRELRAEDNGLRSLANLKPLPRLRALYLSLNRVAELGELEKLSTLRHVMLVHLSQNPVARKPLYRAHIISAVGTVRVIDGKEVTEDEREKSEQVLQAMDPSKQMGVYVFTSSDQVPANSQGGLLEGSNQGLLKQNVQQLGQDKGTGLPMNQRGSVGNENARMNAQQPPLAPPTIMMMGQGLGESSDPRGDASAAMAMRRAVAAVGAPGQFSRVDGSGGSGDSGGASKKLYTSRSHSVPRHVGLEYRPAVMPPGGGRQ